MSEGPPAYRAPPGGKKPSASDTPVVRQRTAEDDRPRWPVVAGVAVVALAAGWLWPRACGLRFATDEENPATAAGGPSTEPPFPSAEPPPSSGDAGVPPPSTAVDPNALAVVTVGKSALMHCQDPPGADLKPSKCGEPALDLVLVPKIEQLATCPAAAGITGRLQIGVDINFKTQVIKVLSGKSSSVQRAGKRDDKAIEPLLSCLRISAKDVAAAVEGGPIRDHARYVLFFPVTITSPAGAGSAPAPVASEKSVTGAAKVEVDTAIVRDAPNTSGAPIGRLSRGTRVTTVGTSGNWYHIKFGDNDAQDGWIFRTNIGK